MSISKRVRFSIFQRDDFTCQYCGQRSPDVVLEVDHRHPRASGGTDDPSNLVTACCDCNRGKSAEHLIVPYALINGPLDGTEFSSRETFPILWVYREPNGDLLTVPDAWRVLRVRGKKLASFFPKLGHPIIGHHKGFHDRWHGPAYPVLLGLYGWEIPGKHAYQHDGLTWSDPDGLLLRLTEIVAALEASDFNEADDVWEADDWDRSDE
jgi:hypothetical protein